MKKLLSVALVLTCGVLVATFSAPADAASSEPRTAGVSPHSTRKFEGIPSFSVSIGAQASGTGVIGPGNPLPYLIRGSWNFPDSWAGQDDPYDIASLEFSMPSCVEYSSLAANTYTYDNQSTKLGSLRTANVAQHAPVWNIADYEKGFVSQADHGNVSLYLNNKCGKAVRVGASFDYEANQGSGIVSVQASFAGLAIRYDGGGLRRQQGSEPLYFTMQYQK